MTTFLQELIEQYEPEHIRIVKRDKRGDTWRYKNHLNCVNTAFFVRHFGVNLMVIKEHNTGADLSHIYDYDAAYRAPSGERMILFQSLPEEDARKVLSLGYDDRPIPTMIHQALDQVVFIPHLGG